MSAVPGGYVALLRLRRAAPLLCLVTAARLVYGVLPLALLLLVSSRRSSYADAGLVLGLYGVSAGVLGPARARLVDRIGPARALPAQAAGLAAALAALAAAVEGPLVVVAALALLAGCTPPAVGPLMRAAWRRLVADEPALVRRAYALDAVAEEGAFVVGPVLGAVAVARTGPVAVLAACLVVLAAASTGLGALVAPLGPAWPQTAPGAPPAPEALWRRPPFVAALVPVAAAGIMLGAFEVGGVALAVAGVGEGAAGVPGTALAAGSLLGGLVYGRRDWPGAARAQATALALATAGLLVVAALLGGALPVFAVAAAAAGTLVAPTMVVTYLAADEAAPPGSSEATAWVNAAFNSGLAAGTAAGGLLADAVSPAAAVLTGAVAGALLVAAARR